MNQHFLSALKNDVVPALGCTEPTSVALAAAHCRELLGQPFEQLEIEVSSHLYKNAMGVYVPGTGQKGLVVAAAAGWLVGEHKEGLEVIRKMDDSWLQPLAEMVQSEAITVSHKRFDDLLYTRAVARRGERYCEVEIRHCHTQVTLKRRDGVTLYQMEPQSGKATASEGKWSLEEIVQFVQGVDISELAFLQPAESLNIELAKEGLQQSWGAAVGSTLLQQQQQGLIADDLLNRAVAWSAAASDARMGGAPLSAMSNSGSGNQGIAATVPVVVAADWLMLDQETKLRALALSHLVAIYCKQSQNKLSALCAVTTAAIGASAAITWMLDGDLAQIDAAICNMTGDISGMLCDGANVGCALKVSSAVSSAVKSSLLAINHRSVIGEGIVADNADCSIANLGRLSREGLETTDRIIVSML